MSSKSTKTNIPDMDDSRVIPGTLAHEITAAGEPAIGKTPVKPLSETSQTPQDINTTITKTADILKNVNTIKDELCKLPLDPCELEYITIRIYPLMNILNQLSNASSNLADSVNVLTASPIVHAKRSDIKDTIHLIYNINEECEDVFKELKHRINRVLED